MERSPIVIVGASLGGLRTAEALRRFGYKGPLTVIGDEPHLPYNRPPLSKEALARGADHADLAFPRRNAIADVSWVLGTRVTHADLEARTVTDERGHTHDYAALVVATGVRPQRLAFSGGQAQERRHVLRTLDDAAGLREALQPGARVVVAGASFIGCEVAATARTLGCDVTVVGAEPYPMQRAIGSELGRELMHRHEERGVRFVMSSRVLKITGTHDSANVQLADGTCLSADVVVEAIGSVYNTELLQGNDVDSAAGILTDGAMRVLRMDGRPWSDVFAVGDVARFPNALFDHEPVAVGHWNIPTETAKRAGRVLAVQMQGAPELSEVLAEPFAPVPSFWSDQFDIHLLAYGLPSRASRVELLEGTVGGDCVFGYFRAEKLVGVCGIGSKAALMRYRAQIAS